MKQLWLIVHLKTIFRNDRTGFTCFCFHLKNIKSFEKQLKPVVLQRGAVFTCTWTTCIKQRQFASTLTIDIYTYMLYMTYIYIYKCILYICMLYIYYIYVIYIMYNVYRCYIFVIYIYYIHILWASWKESISMLSHFSWHFFNLACNFLIILTFTFAFCFLF